MRMDQRRKRILASLALTASLSVVDGWVARRRTNNKRHQHGPLTTQPIVGAIGTISGSSQVSSSFDDDADVPSDAALGTHSDGGKRTQELLETFLSHVQEFVQADQIQAFTLKGPSKKILNDSARGCLRMVKGRSIVLTKKKVIQVTFKYHAATDICKNWEVSDCVANLEAILLQRDLSAVVPASEWGAAPVSPLGSPHGMQSALLQTTNGTEWELQVGGGGGTKTPKLTQRRVKEKTACEMPQRHDRVKQGPVDVTAPVWQALGVTSSASSGTVKAGMSSKIRQCQKFVEIVDRLVTESISVTPEDRISVVDMGCGRGYLTFALHSFLYAKYGTAVSSRGIDVRPKLVTEISCIAQSLGHEFEALRFETGTIESFLAESTTREDDGLDNNSLRILIALHACDTATDDAIWSAIARDANVIVVAPCCHRQVRPQLNQHAADAKVDHPYADILRHNIYRERLAETVTDSMRALLLELSGYTVQVFEFVGGEHTSKNVMITAVKKQQSTNSNEKDERLYKDRLDRIRGLAKLHGIRDQKLAEWMKICLSDNVEPQPRTNGARRKPLSASSMPPLRK